MEKEKGQKSLADVVLFLSCSSQDFLKNFKILSKTVVLVKKKLHAVQKIIL